MEVDLSKGPETVYFPSLTLTSLPTCLRSLTLLSRILGPTWIEGRDGHGRGSAYRIPTFTCYSSWTEDDSSTSWPTSYRTSRSSCVSCYCYYYYWSTIPLVESRGDQKSTREDGREQEGTQGGPSDPIRDGISIDPRYTTHDSVTRGSKLLVYSMKRDLWSGRERIDWRQRIGYWMNIDNTQRR